MTRTSLRRLTCSIFFLALCSGKPRAQGTQQQEAVSISEFFRVLVQNYDPATPPKFEDLLKLQRQVASMPPKDISDAMPSISKALTHHDDTVKKYAAAALFSIGSRPDSALLLKSYITVIGNLFSFPNPHLQTAAVQVLTKLRPQPPPEVWPLLLAFAKRPDCDPIAQASALSSLLEIAPETPDLPSTLDGFLARPLDHQTREAILNGIANSHTKDIHVVHAVVAALNDSDEGIRFTAAQAFSRMGRDAILQAQPILLKLVGSPDESAQVKSAAKDALQMIGPSH
jgi:HEAT repeat protein